MHQCACFCLILTFLDHIKRFFPHTNLFDVFYLFIYLFWISKATQLKTPTLGGPQAVGTAWLRRLRSWPVIFETYWKHFQLNERVILGWTSIPSLRLQKGQKLPFFSMRFMSISFSTLLGSLSHSCMRTNGSRPFKLSLCQGFGRASRSETEPWVSPSIVSPNKRWPEKERQTSGYLC